MSASTDPDTPADEADLGALKRAEDPSYPTDRAPDAVVVLDPGEGRFVTVDAQAELLFGMDRQRLTGVGPVDVSPPEQPDGRPSDAAMAGYIDRAIRGETPSFAWLFRRADGTDVRREVRFRALPGPDGGTLVIGSLIDVTPHGPSGSVRVVGCARGEGPVRRVHRVAAGRIRDDGSAPARSSR